MKQILICFFLLIPALTFSQGLTCAEATQICTGSNYSYTALVSQPNSQSYGCLGSTPCRFWFYMYIGTPGNITIYLYSSNPQHDIDFACWGPFNSVSDGCSTGIVPGSYATGTNNLVSCSYSGSWNETCQINNAVAGKYYILLITNFSQAATTINFSQTAGPGVMSCLSPPACTNNGPVCSGQSIQLQASTIAGATYTWTGPAGFFSNVQNPVINNATAANSGIYSCTVTVNSQTSAAGTTTVVVNPTPSATVISNTSICYGTYVSIGGASQAGSTYSWTSSPPGFTSNLANPSVSPIVTTTYTLTETAGGCNNSHSVTITILPRPIAFTGQDATLCSGSSMTIGAGAVAGNTYSWTSNPSGFTSSLPNPIVSPTVTTTYTLTETNSFGCTRTNSVTIYVNPSPDALTGPAQAVCEGASCSLGVAPVTGNTYAWTSVPAGFTSASSSVAVTPSVTTVYTLTETITSTGCEKSNEVTVTVNVLPEAFTGPNTSICSGSFAQLGANPVAGNVYAWTSSPPGYSSTQAHISVNPGISTTYTLIETTTATGCCDTNDVLVTVYPNPAAYTGPSQTICNGTSITLGAAAVPGNTYSWVSDPPGFTSTLSNPTVQPIVNTKYILTETGQGGCQATNFINIIVNAIPAANAGSNSTSCAGSPVTIGGPPVFGHTFSWSSNPPGFSSGVSNPLVYPTVTTTYTLIETIMATGCSKSNSVTITVNPLPVPIVIPNTAICNGNSISLGGSPVAGHTYSWSSNPPGFTSTSSNPSVSPSVATTYTLIEFINSSGCSKSASTIITVNPLPQAYTGPGTAVCAGSPVIIGGSPVNGNSYSWTSTPTGYFSSVSNPLIYPSVTTQYNLTETITATGCSKSNSVTVTVNPSPTVTLSPFAPVCENAAPFALSGGSPPGGAYYGTGVSGGIFNPGLLIPGNYNITYSYTNTYGCTGAQVQTITVQHEPVITGLIRYDNVFNTPLDSTRVILKNNAGIPLDSLISNNSGAYTFYCLTNGTYRITTRPNKAWGGGNATDALIISRYAVGQTTLAGLRLQAGDVNLSGTVNAGDSYLVMRRWAHLINSFAAGDWISETNNNVAVNNLDVSCNLLAICTGDVNGSYVPPLSPGPIMKSATRAEMISQGVVDAVPGEEIKIPVLADQDLNFNAISLVLAYDWNNMEIKEVYSDLPGFIYNATGGQVRFCWYGLETMKFRRDDPLLEISCVIKCDPAHKSTISFSPGPETEFSGADASPIPEVRLKVPALHYTPGNNDQGIFSVEVVQDHDGGNMVAIKCKNSSTVKISLLRIPGDLVRVIYDGPINEGTYHMLLPGKQVSPGVYLLRYSGCSGNETISGTRKIVLLR